MNTVMAFSFVLIWHLSVDQNRLEEFMAVTDTELAASRNFEGNIRFDILSDSVKPGQIVFIEEWESQAAQQKYWHWRVENGDVESLQEYLITEPVLNYYEKRK